MSNRRPDARVDLVLALLAGVAVVFFVLPLVGLLLRAPWSSAISQLTDRAALTALRLSLVVSIWAVALSLVLGFPLAWVLARTRFPGRGVVRTLALLPMVMPPVVGGVALLSAFGRHGVLGGALERVGIHLPFTTAGAVLAVTFISAPFMVMSLEAGLRSLDARYEDAAATLGASRWRTIRWVVLPALRPALLAGAALTWARALGEFGATITFAGRYPGRTETLPLAIYNSLNQGLDGAIMLSLLLVAVSLAILFALRGRILPR